MGIECVSEIGNRGIGLDGYRWLEGNIEFG
jgi:hypothetical protein